MVMVLVLVFLAVFAVTALLLTASRTNAQQTEQTLNALKAALATTKLSPATRQSIFANRSCSAPFHGSIAGC